MNLIKLTVLMLTLSWGLLANSATVQDEFKIILPPEPDPVLNATTIHGIDTNKNGVRDDIEIYLYKNVSQDWNLFNAYLQYYKNEHETIRELNNISKFDYYTGEGNWKTFNCIGYFDPNVKMGSRKMINLFYNTPARREKLKEVSQKMKGFERTLKNREQKIKDCNFKVKG